MSLLTVFLERGVACAQPLLDGEPGTPEFDALRAAVAELNDEFEEATTPGGTPEWFAMSTLLQQAVAYGKEPTLKRRALLLEALDNARGYLPLPKGD